MKKNKLLFLATLLCNYLRFATFCGIFIIISTLVYWHTNPTIYDSTIAKASDLESGLSFKSSKLTYSYVRKAEALSGAANSTINQSNLKPDTVYLLNIQGIGLAFLWLLILKEIERVIASVQGLQTFKQGNSNSFRKIGWYCFYIFVLAGFEWLHTTAGHRLNILIDFTPLFFMLICFVLAEIFKEGNKLYEVEQFTI